MISRYLSFVLPVIIICAQSPFAEHVGSPAGITQDSAARPPAVSDEALLTAVEWRAFRFFWEQTDSFTGLTLDRAWNRGPKHAYTVASIASTGYALSALAVGVKHGWIDSGAAYRRALLTLRFVLGKLPNVHGWCYHFIDWRTGERQWSSEVSTIDTTLLMEGALVAGRFWKGTEVERLANSVYDRADWTWVRTNDGSKPRKLTVSHGWTPERGFISSEWDQYCESMSLYLLGLGSRTNPLPRGSWAAWGRNVVEYGGMKTLAGGPIFMHQMAHGYFDFRDSRDSLGWDYWVSSTQATLINRQFCIDQMKTSKTYAPNVWGINANDYPDGYKAFSAPGDEDGTVSPTGAIASVTFTPELSKAAAQAIYRQFGDKLWGRYGFGNAFNVDRNWYDQDVIGIDLGMAMIAIENHRTGLIWRLMSSQPAIRRAWKRAGFRRTSETRPRLLYRNVIHGNPSSIHHERHLQPPRFALDQKSHPPHAPSSAT